MLAFATLPRLEKRVYDVIGEKKMSRVICHFRDPFVSLRVCYSGSIKGSKKRYAYKTKYTLVGLTRHSQTINE